MVIVNHWRKLYHHYTWERQNIFCVFCCIFINGINRLKMRTMKILSFDSMFSTIKKWMITIKQKFDLQIDSLHNTFIHQFVHLHILHGWYKNFILDRRSKNKKGHDRWSDFNIINENLWQRYARLSVLLFFFKILKLQDLLIYQWKSIHWSCGIFFHNHNLIYIPSRRWLEWVDEPTITHPVVSFIWFLKSIINYKWRCCIQFY